MAGPARHQPATGVRTPASTAGDGGILWCARSRRASRQGSRSGRHDGRRGLSPRKRLDAELVRRGLASSRNQAAELIDAGAVLVSGTIALRPARLVDPAEPIVISGPPPRFVSRGGEKLDAALDQFAVDVRGVVALDAGASTGGFTDCLLQRGAAAVVAVDVGRGQLHERLRSDRRVRSLEQVNIRTATLADLGGQPFRVVVADLSFISLRLVAGPLVGCTAPGGDLIVLVKPQFEAGRREVSRGRGVIRDPGIWGLALREVISALDGAGAAMMGVMVSPLRGADGNVEFLVHLRVGAVGNGPAEPTREVEAAVAAAQARSGS
jgi:23S rRNA (cytidine1920-2'-O)/16S rRNA (cytidine1409-2'-O)-methyltransferase